MKLGRRADAEKLLLNFSFIQTKTEQFGPHSLIEDYDRIGWYPNTPLGMIRGAIQLSAHVLAERPFQLPQQLLARLLNSGDSVLDAFLSQCVPSGTWLRPINRCMTPPGGPIIRTFEGPYHTNTVSAAVCPNGKTVASCDINGKIILWDTATGEPARQFLCKTGYANFLQYSPGGVLVQRELDFWGVKIRE